MDVTDKYHINVLWDIENCAVPNGVAPHQIAENIRHALASVNLYGPIVMTAYGDSQLFPKNVQQALIDTSIIFKHIPHDKKEAADKVMICDIFLWALNNSSPAHLFLISGDRDFSHALHGLKNLRYNVLLAALPRVQVSPSLTDAASTIWDWGKLARGELARGRFVTLKQSDTNPDQPCDLVESHDSTRALPQAASSLKQEAVGNPVASAASNHVRNATNQTSNLPSSQASNHPKQTTTVSSPSPEPGPGHLQASMGVSDPLARTQPGIKPAVQKPATGKVYAEVHNRSLPDVEGPSPEPGRQGFVGITKEHRELLQLVMDGLRAEAVVPSEEHMHCCFDQVAERLRGRKMHPQSPEFELLLQAALTQRILEREEVEMDSGAVYFMRGASKWEYHNSLDSVNPYDTPVWDALHTCLQRDSKTKTSPVLKCKNWYQAAEHVKSLGPPPLSTLRVGDLMRLLRLAGRVEWIVMEDPSSRKWQPIRYDLPIPTGALQGERGSLYQPPNQRGANTVGGKIGGPESGPTSTCTVPHSVKPPLKPASSEGMNTDGYSVAKTALGAAPGLALLHATLPPVVPPKPVSSAASTANAGRAKVGVNVELEFRRWLALSFGSKGKLRGGAVLGSLLGFFKADTGLVANWKSWGFARESVFLQAYPDLILVITLPPPGKVVRAAYEARIDLEALLGQVLPAGGKQGLPLDQFVADFRNKFQYQLARSDADLRNLRITMESMTQLVEVRKEGAKTILYQASGAATWRFSKTMDAVGVAGKGPETKPGPAVDPNPNPVRVPGPRLIPSTPLVEYREKKGPIADVTARDSVGDTWVGNAVNVELVFRKWLAHSFGSKGEHRHGMALAGMMGRFRGDSGHVVNWGKMGFSKFAKFLETYPDLIQVITRPAPGLVVPAEYKARIDLEALLGKVLPGVGKVGMPLDRLIGKFWIEFGYPISSCLKYHKNIQTLLESMTQLVYVRKEGKAWVLYEATGTATWHFHPCMGVGGQVEARSGGLCPQEGGGAGRSGQQERALVWAMRKGGGTQMSHNGTGTPEGPLDKGVGTESGRGEDSRPPSVRSESEGGAAGDVSGEGGETKSEAPYEAKEELEVEGEGEGEGGDGDGDGEAESDSVGWEGSVSGLEEVVEKEEEEDEEDDVKEVIMEEVEEGGGNLNTLAVEETGIEKSERAEGSVERGGGNEGGRRLIEAVETESAAAHANRSQDKRGMDVEMEGKGGGVEGRVEVGKGLAVLLSSLDVSGSGDLALMMSTGRGLSGVREAEVPAKGFSELFAI